MNLNQNPVKGMNLMKNNPILITFALSFYLLLLSCDEKAPVDSDGSSSGSEAGKYNLNLISQPMATDSLGSSVSVGEDFAGTQASSPFTYLTATLTDTAGKAISDKLISFAAEVGGTEFGNFDLSSDYTNASGVVNVKFYDGSASAYDNSSTQTFEGVNVTATFAASEGSAEDNVTAVAQFDVYDTSLVTLWPYSLQFDSDKESINLGGNAKATIEAKVLAKRNNTPVVGADIFFYSIDDKGLFADNYKATDSTGRATTTFEDTGNPNEVGVITLRSAFNHPNFGTVWDSVNITVVDTTYSGIPAYIEIPPCAPDELIIVGGGGIESTNLKANVYDENGVLVNEPTKVSFTLGPNIPAGANINNAGITDTAYTVNGVATVSLNSGTGPGPVRVTASVSFDTSTISSNAVPVIIATGPAMSIFPDYDLNDVTPIGSGFYQMQVAAIVYDLWNNPVADSTYVYWTMNVADEDLDSVLSAQIEGVSFTGNKSNNDESFQGVTFSNIIFPSHDMLSNAVVTALCFGGDLNNDGIYGDSVTANIEDNVVLPFHEGLNGSLNLYVSETYWDFTTMGATATIVATAILFDHYSNPIKDARIMFSAAGASAYSEYGETHQDDGWGPSSTGAGDGCFSWLDANENSWHDREEVWTETYTDTDENNFWTGYPHIVTCGTPIVRTDADGYTRVVMTFAQSLCTPIPNSDPTQYNDFTSTVTAQLLDPVSISSDPVSIEFIRSWDGTGKAESENDVR